LLPENIEMATGFDPIDVRARIWCRKKRQNTSEDHSFLYTDVALWESDVIAFLDAHVKK